MTVTELPSSTTFVLFLYVFAAGQLLYWQDPNAPSPINTDRPAFADSSVVVPKRSLQIENGFLETTVLGQQAFDFTETQLRFGVGDKDGVALQHPGLLPELPFCARLRFGLGGLDGGSQAATWTDTRI